MNPHSPGFPVDFMITAEVPCPYLPGRMERKLVTELKGDKAPALFNLLSHAGFRRSHNIAYRPACPGCNACVPVRIHAARFKPSRSMRRIARRNADLRLAILPAKPTHEQFALFARYIAGRHAEGEMISMGPTDYGGMIGNSPVDTRLLECRDASGALIACCLTDWGLDGISAVYSFFDPAQTARSLGTFVVLALIQEALRQSLPYLYLGYWIAESRKMAYKQKFQPLEAYGAKGWQPLVMS